MQQLETNAKEMDAISEELQSIEESIETEYDSFSQTLNSKRRQEQEQNAKEIMKNAKTIEEARKLMIEKEKQMAEAAAMAAANASEPQKVINNILNKINTTVAQLPIPTGKSAPPPVSMSVIIDPTSSKTKKTDDLGSVLMPNEDELNRFLDDSLKSSKSEQNLTGNKQHEDCEEDDHELSNPMVAAFKENIDSSDEDTLSKAQIQRKQSAKTFFTHLRWF